MFHNIYIIDMYNRYVYIIDMYNVYMYNKCV